LFPFFRFVYLGPKGTSTPLHADVLRSFSWSTNVCGQKRWYFIPPLHTHLLYDLFGAKLAYHVHADLSMENGDARYCASSFMSIMYPGLQIARRYAITIVQEAGETVFVPSNWFHTVENLVDTLAINHNWLNGANIRQCWCYVDLKSRSTNSFQKDQKVNDKFTALCENESLDNIRSAKVDDDVLLLWEVVVKKTSLLILQQRKKHAIRLIDQFDIEGILFVIDGILTLERDGFVSMMALNNIRNIKELRSEVVTCLC
jgi:JmjC domain, hydroxylase